MLTALECKRFALSWWIQNSWKLKVSKINSSFSVISVFIPWSFWASSSTQVLKIYIQYEKTCMQSTHTVSQFPVPLAEQFSSLLFFKYLECRGCSIYLSCCSLQPRHNSEHTLEYCQNIAPQFVRRAQAVIIPNCKHETPSLSFFCTLIFSLMALESVIPSQRPHSTSCRVEDMREYL